MVGINWPDMSQEMIPEHLAREWNVAMRKVRKRYPRACFELPESMDDGTIVMGFSRHPTAAGLDGEIFTTVD